MAYQTVSRTADAEVLVQFELSDTAERFGVVARGAFGTPTTFGNGSADTYLVADVGNSELRLRRVDAGSSSNLVSPDSVSLSASTKYWLRVSVSTVSSQAVVKAKVWEDGDPEPGAWDLEGTDTSGSQLAAGSMGLYFMAPSTVASPVITVDALTGTVYGTYTDDEHATTIDTPAVLEVPKDHLAVAVMKSGSNTRPGSFYSFGFDGIGNRLAANQRSAHGEESHTPDILNQTTERHNAGTVHISGFAAVTATVLVNDRPALRDGEHYYSTVTVDNSSGPVVAETTVTIITKTADGDTTSETTIKTLVPKAVEDDELSYHDRGNFLTDSIFDYTWDLKDRLIQVQTNVSITDDEAKVKVTFEYDAFDRRTKKRVYSWDPEEGESGDWVLEKSIRFVWDGWLLWTEVDDEGGLIRSYVWGKDMSGSLQRAGGVGGLLAIKDHVANKVYWVTADGNGNVMQLIDSSNGSKVVDYEYGPFGNGVVADGTFAGENPLRFSTKYCDAEIGLYYYGYRYYDWRNGRWISRDPIAERGCYNMWAFCRHPVSSFDKNGCEDPRENPLSLLKPGNGPFVDDDSEDDDYADLDNAPAPRLEPGLAWGIWQQLVAPAAIMGQATDQLQRGAVEPVLATADTVTNVTAAATGWPVNTELSYTYQPGGLVDRTHVIFMTVYSQDGNFVNAYYVAGFNGSAEFVGVANFDNVRVAEKITVQNGQLGVRSLNDGEWVLEALEGSTKVARTVGMAYGGLNIVSGLTGRTSLTSLRTGVGPRRPFFSTNTYSGASGTNPTKLITLEQAAAAGERAGIDMRMFKLRFESTQHYGFVTKVGFKVQKLWRAPDGRIYLTLSEKGLASEAAAVNTIAHETNHVRGFLRTGVMTEESAARAAGNAAEKFFSK